MQTYEHPNENEVVASHYLNLIYYDIEGRLLSCDAHMWKRRKLAMLRLFKKRSKAVRKWHDKAMLIDPAKTKLIIIRTH